MPLTVHHVRQFDNRAVMLYAKALLKHTVYARKNHYKRRKRA